MGFRVLPNGGDASLGLYARSDAEPRYAAGLGEIPSEERHPLYASDWPGGMLSHFHSDPLSARPAYTI